MKIIVAIDEKNGMAFNKRRQSQDVELRKYILDLCDGQALWMNAYSAKQFAAHDATNIKVSENFLTEGESAYCFVEDTAVLPYAAAIDTVYLCRWNRAYPNDRKFDLDMSNGWECVSTTDIVGKSHEKITIERWCKV